jgi:putative PIN family toxin of toxin-antitoxin system
VVNSLRVVLDTNILVSAFFWEGNERKILLKCKKRKFNSITSLEILNELEKVLKIKFKVPVNKIRDYSKEILYFSEIVFPLGELEIIKEDPTDNIILETALIGKANILVTGNKHLLKLKKYKSIKILQSKDVII